MYDRATEAWALVFSIVAQLQARGACSKMFSRLMWASFCRFFRQMLIASKVRDRQPLPKSLGMHPLHVGIVVVSTPLASRKLAVEHRCPPATCFPPLAQAPSTPVHILAAQIGCCWHWRWHGSWI